MRARIVLAATGLGGRVDASNGAIPNDGSRIGAGVIADGFPRDYRPNTIYMACGSAGYVGLVQIENGRLDVAAAFDPRAAKASGGPGPLAVATLASAGFPAIPNLESLPWKGTPHLTRSAPRLGEERLFVLGDAAGYVEPFTGEGMAWALAGAALLAPIAVRSIDSWRPSDLAEWERTYRRAVKGRQFVCRATAAMLRRPALTKFVVRALGLMPSLSRPALRAMYRV